jgi:hypothetical protein
MPFHKRRILLQNPLARAEVVLGLTDLGQRIEALRSQGEVGPDGMVEMILVHNTTTFVVLDSTEAKEAVHHVDFIQHSAVFVLDGGTSGLVTAIELYSSHLFMDGLGAEALVEATRSILGGKSIDIPRSRLDFSQEGNELTTEYWRKLLIGAPRSNPISSTGTQLDGHAWVTSTRQGEQIHTDLRAAVARASVLPSSVWLSAAALAVWEAAGRPDTIVARGTASNRLDSLEESVVDYRAQAVFLPLEIESEWTCEAVLRSINGRNLRSLLKGRFDALKVVDSLNDSLDQTGANFKPAVELNYMPTSGLEMDRQGPWSEKVPYRYSPTSAKADIAVLVTMDLVRVSHRAGTQEDSLRTLHRLLWWLTKFSEGYQTLGEIADRPLGIAVT